MSFGDLIKVAEEKAKDDLDKVEKINEIVVRINPKIKYRKIFSRKDMRGYAELFYGSGFKNGYLYRRREEKKSIYLL